MTVKGGTNQACAACKYQRRKCSADCQLAPYFPPDQPKMFQNAHKLFGVSNILKVLKHLHPNQHKEAMRSIIYHANVRDRSPVYGVYGICLELENQLQQFYMELEAVNAQLALCRQQQYNNQFSTGSPPHNNNNSSPSSKLQLGQASSPPNSALPLFQQCRSQQQPQPFNPNGISIFTPNQAAAGLAYGNNVSQYNAALDYVDPKDVNANPIWMQQQQQQPYNQNNNNNNNNYSTTNQPQFLGGQEQLPIKQPGGVEEEAQDYDEIPAFFDIIDDRQSYVDSKEAYESSSDSSLKDTRSNVEQVSENELKSAAACFTLTSVN